MCYVLIRNEQVAIEHWRINTLQRCFMAWYYWSRTMLQKRHEEKQHEVKMKKMTAFLEAAATGKLWNKDESRGNLSKQAKSIHTTEIVDDDTMYEIAIDQPVKKTAKKVIFHLN